MQIQGDAKLLRIFVGESDVIKHVPVYEQIVMEARKSGLAGATVYKGVMGFGGNSRLHTAKILRLSEDLPVIIEIVDEISKIETFLPAVDKLFEDAACGGLITMEKADIIKYKANRKGLAKG
jgi:PII-like signaling protein